MRLSSMAHVQHNEPRLALYYHVGQTCIYSGEKASGDFATDSVSLWHLFVSFPNRNEWKQTEKIMSMME